MIWTYYQRRFQKFWIIKNLSDFIFSGILALIFSFTPTLVKGAPNYDAAIKKRKDGNFVASEKDFETLIKNDSKNAELWYQLGLTQRFQDKLKPALEAQKTALSLDPEKKETKIELARLYYWTGNKNKSKLLLAEILQDTSDGLAEELSQEHWVVALTSDEGEKLKEDSPPKPVNSDIPYRWQSDAGYEHSNFSRLPQPIWRNYFVQLGYAITNRTRIHTRGEWARRFHVNNEHYELGINHKFENPIIIGGSAGYTPQSVFIPRWRFKGEFQGRIWKKTGYVGDIWALMNGQHDRYKTINTSTIKPGLRYFLIDSLSIQTQYVGVIDENKKHLKGWSLRADWETFVKGVRLYGGISNTPETEDRITVKTLAKFAGFSVEIHPRITLHGAYAREDRKNSYIRHIFSGAISLKG